MRVYLANGLRKPAIFYTFAISVSDSPGTSVNNYSPTLFGPGTNRLLITAASGGTTITGLNATGISDGAPIAVLNDSDTDLLNFTNKDSGSLTANQFITPGAGTFSLIPRAGALLVRVGSNWRFL